MAGPLLLIQTTLLMLFSLSRLAAQLKPIEEIGPLDVNHEHAAWPAPESIVRDLRSSNEDVRLKAMAAVWVPKALLHGATYSRNPDGTGKVSGSLFADRSKSSCAMQRWEATKTQQAVVAVQVGQYAYATVARPKGNGWERVAQFNCWCKYDMDHFMDEFLSLVRAPERDVERFRTRTACQRRGIRTFSPNRGPLSLFQRRDEGRSFI